MPSKRGLWAFAALASALGAASAHADTITVAIEKMAFSPAEIHAKVGDTIEWVNKDALVHTATVRGGWEVMLPAKKSGSIVVESIEFDRLLLSLSPEYEGPHHRHGALRPATLCAPIGPQRKRDLRLCSESASCRPADSVFHRASRRCPARQADILPCVNAESLTSSPASSAAGIGLE